MKKLLWIIICLSAVAGMKAQKQEGIVRTLERPGKPSVGVQGVTINVLEYPNAIVSNKGGKFSFSIPGKHQGESFTLSRVQKKGYTLVDNQLKGRRMAYSFTVPVEIVIVPDQQLENDKKRIEDKAYDRARRDYEQRLSALEKQLTEKSISEREYREKYEELNDNYNNYIKLIDKMAEKYAMTDYKGLTPLNQEIQACIENAELERANEIINTKGDFDQREQELNNKRAVKEKSEQLAQQLEKDINIELLDLKQDYYNKYYIHALAYRNDSAAYYLERLVKLDTTDIEMIESTAHFIDQYLADYPKAIKYYMMALDYYKANYEEDCQEIGDISQKIGLLYDNNQEQDKALEWHHKALDVMKRSMDPKSPSVSMAYTLIGRAYITKKEYDKALEYTLTGLDMRERAALPDTSDLAQSYNNLGVIYNCMNENDKALECHMKALHLREQAFGKDSGLAAFSHLNIGLLYAHGEDDDKALEHLDKAYQVYHKTLGIAHPYTMSVTSHIGTIYTKRGDYDKALTYLQEYTSGCKKYYGEDSYEAASSLYNLADVYQSMGDKAHALECLQQALEIFEKRPEATEESLDFFREAIQKLKEGK